MQGAGFVVMSSDFVILTLSVIQRESTTYEKSAIPFQSLSATSASDTAGESYLTYLNVGALSRL
jgi:hypothetical protein